MMVRRVLSISAGLLAALMLPLAAQAQVSLAGGKTFPLGDFANDAVDGWIAQVSVHITPPSLPVGLRLDYQYADFRNVEREPSLYARTGGEWFRQSGFILNVTKELPMGTLAPYALVGAGVLREWHGDYSYSGTNHYSLATNIGVGVSVPLGGSSVFFVEGRGTNLVGSKSLPLTLPAVNLDGVKFRSVPVLIGLRF